MDQHGICSRRASSCPATSTAAFLQWRYSAQASMGFILKHLGATLESTKKGLVLGARLERVRATSIWYLKKRPVRWLSWAEKVVLRQNRLSNACWGSWGRKQRRGRKLSDVGEGHERCPVAQLLSSKSAQRQKIEDRAQTGRGFTFPEIHREQDDGVEIRSLL